MSTTVGPLRPLPRPQVFDWQHLEDGPLTVLDIELGMGVLDDHPAQAVRDAGRKIRRFLTEARG